MNRKGFLMVVVVAVLAAGSAFAQMPEFKLSAGAGGLFVSDFGGGVKTSNSEVKNSYAGGGGFAFFDATFAELSFGFFATGGDIHRVNTVTGDTIMKNDISYTGLDISLLGKYPFTLTEQFTLFPLLGITYRHFISVKSSNPNIVESYALKGSSALWFKLGVGADYAFTEHIFARLGVLYGLRLANKWEKDRVAVSAVSTRLGHGLDVKLAVGYRF
jgi:outer membrane protein W